MGKSSDYIDILFSIIIKDTITTHSSEEFVYSDRGIKVSLDQLMFCSNPREFWLYQYH